MWKIGYATCIIGHTARFRALTKNRLKKKMNNYLNVDHFHPEI